MTRTAIQCHLDNIVKELLHGLTTDGAHHKQHTLEQVLQLLVEPEWYEKAKREFQWEDGIPS
jgi:hypothetical protein